MQLLVILRVLSVGLGSYWMMCKLGFGRPCMQPFPSLQESVNFSRFLWGLSFLGRALLLPPGSLWVCTEWDKHHTTLCSSHRRENLQSVSTSGKEGWSHNVFFFLPWLFTVWLSSMELPYWIEAMEWASLSLGNETCSLGLGKWAVLQEISRSEAWF